MFDFKNQDVVNDYYVFRKSTYNRESAEATRLRGVGGVAVNGDLDIPMARQTYASASTSTQSARTKSTNFKTHSTRFHKVSKGETLSSIAKKRGMTVSAICKLNHIKASTKIRPGQILRYN
jgi:LysM repeat protein